MDIMRKNVDPGNGWKGSDSLSSFGQLLLT